VKRFLALAGAFVGLVGTLLALARRCVLPAPAPEPA
jgi:hypothetical protein